MNISKKAILSFIVALTSVISMAQPYYHIMKEENGKLTEDTVYNGKDYNIKIDMMKYTFRLVTPTPIEYKYDQTVNSLAQYESDYYDFFIDSYVTINNKNVPVDWTITKYEYSDDDGENWIDNGTKKPSWLRKLSMSDGYYSFKYTYRQYGRVTLEPAELVNVNPVTTLLKKATAKSNYDLSQGGETANCYVISAPGTYKIPLIIGNARKADGTVNDVCFNNPKPYVTYKNNAITSMWLKDHGGTPTSGSLVWSDCGDNIVSDLSVSGDFLTFTVSADNIVQGNAVVAVKDEEGKIMWSWHLWFTDSDALSTIAFDNYSGETQYFTRDILGFVTDSYMTTTYSPSRRVRVTVTQTGTNKTAQFQIIQKGYRRHRDFYGTYYQFGRKDAFPCSTYCKYVFSYTSPYWKSIQNPRTFFKKDWCCENTWHGEYYNIPNAWAVGNTGLNLSGATSEIVKSIYDPCPAGFKVPGRNAFTGFTSDGIERKSWDRINGFYDAEDMRYKFTDKNGNTIQFPGIGYIYFDEKTGRGSGGSGASRSISCWTADIKLLILPGDYKNYNIFQLNCYYGYDNSIRFDPTFHLKSIGAWGCSVRPVKDR